jgi:beta-propeller repeat-containing protein
MDQQLGLVSGKEEPRIGGDFSSNQVTKARLPRFGDEKMKKLIVLTALTLMVSLAYLLAAPFFEVRALVANPHFAHVAIPQTQTPRPIRTLPGVEEIRVWLGPNIIDYSFGLSNTALTARRATLDSSSYDMRPPAPEGRAQFYDIFYSNADGTLNADGAYLTIEAVTYSQENGEGGGNVAEVGLRSFGSTTFEYGNAVAYFVTLGYNARAYELSNAIDGNTQTYTTLGNTAGQSSQRLSITIGFASSSGFTDPTCNYYNIEAFDRQFVPSSGGITTFEVRSSPGCLWSAFLGQGTAEFIFFAGSAQRVYGSGDGTVRYSAASNPNAASRSGIIEIWRESPRPELLKRITVSQEGRDCVLSDYSISPASRTFHYTGGVAELIVRIPAGAKRDNCPLVVQSDASWLFVVRVSDPLDGFVRIFYSVHKYDNDSSGRYGTISVNGRIHQVYQNPSGCVIDLICAFFPTACTSSVVISRGFRDDVLAKTPRGQKYTQLYYKLSTEAVGILLLNPSLVLRSREMMQRYMPLVQAMVRKEQVTLTEGDIEEIDGFLRSLAEKGATEFKQTVKSLCEDLRDPQVHKEFDITIVAGSKREISALDGGRVGAKKSLMIVPFGLFLICLYRVPASRKKSAKLAFRRLFCAAIAFSVVSLQWPVVSGQRRTTALRASSKRRPTDKAAAASKTLSRLPLSFEVNQGQLDSQVKFFSRANGYNLYLTSTEAVIVTSKNANGKTQHWQSVHSTNDRQPLTGDVLRMTLASANTDPRVRGSDRLQASANYFLGDQAQWTVGVPSYARVKYENVYTGIDIVYYGNRNQLEYDFIVAPGIDPTAIKLNFEGAENIEVDREGDLILRNAGGELRQRKPVVYQDVGGGRREISGQYIIRNPQSAIRNQEVGFDIGPHDTTRPLIIDPVLAFSSYLGGGGNEEGNSIAVDSAGTVYVAGFTDSINFPLVSATQPAMGGGQQDAFVAKLDPSGTRLLYSTYIGGDGQDNSTSIAVDSSGDAYITGFTDSTNFPVRNWLQQEKKGEFNAFVVKLDPTGSLLYSTLFGGSSSDFASSIAVDSSGNAYVAGLAASPDIPIANALQSAHGGLLDIYLAKINPSGRKLVFSTYLGGSNIEGASSIAVDASGNIYLTGVTSSRDFRTASPLQPSHGGGMFDAFITKINPSGSQIIYSTYLGGSGEDRAFRIAVDSAGNAYVTGDTDSTNFPTANAVQKSIGGSADAFVAKINASGSALVYSTYLGGSALDGGTAIAIDSVGNAYAAGFTGSANFPTINPVQQENGGGSFDAFVAKLSSSGSTLEWSTYLGGSGIDAGFGIAVDSSGVAYVMGQTASTDFPTASPLQPVNGGGASDLFIAKLVPIGVTGVHIAGASVSGKKLLVFGSGFDSGAKILLSGESQKTINDEQSPTTALIAKKAGKMITPGQTVTLQVRNSDGTLSNQFSFTK